MITHKPQYLTKPNKYLLFITCERKHVSYKLVLWPPKIVENGWKT